MQTNVAIVANTIYINYYLGRVFHSKISTYKSYHIKYFRKASKIYEGFQSANIYFIVQLEEIHKWIVSATLALSFGCQE